MIDSIVFAFLNDLMLAAAIWSVLLVVAIVAIAAIAGRRSRRERPTEESRVRGAALKRARLAALAEELDRHARTVAIAADRAIVTAHRRRQEWLAAQSQVDAAWRAYEAGDAEAMRLLAAAALPTPRTPATPAEYVARERFLHRKAMAACSRRELSALDLSDALANRNGWDPKLHPVEQEVVLRCVSRDSMLAGYRVAATRERAAWQAAEVAAVAARSLREEAFLAKERARLTPRPAGSQVAPVQAYSGAMTMVTTRLPVLRIGT